MNTLLNSDQILILDSDDKTRKELCDMLRSLHVPEEQLICSTTIQEALEIIETGKVGLVIVEASDAIKQKYSICSLIEANPKTQVLIKAYIEELGPIRIAAVRVHGILEKPIKKEDLQFQLKTALKIRAHHKALEDIVQALQPTKDCLVCPGNPGTSDATR